MPHSCKTILDNMVYKGAMTMDERNKILRNLKNRKPVYWLYDDEGILGSSIYCCPMCGALTINPKTKRYCYNCGVYTLGWEKDGKYFLREDDDNIIDI